MSNTYASLQLDNEGNEIDLSAPEVTGPTEWDEVTATDVGLLNDQMRAASASMRTSSADEINRSRELTRAAQESSVFAERAAEAGARSNEAFQRGDHATAHRLASEADRLERIAGRTAHSIIDRAAMNSALDAARAERAGPSLTDKLQAALDKQVANGVWDAPA